MDSLSQVVKGSVGGSWGLIMPRGWAWAPVVATGGEGLVWW